MWSLILTSFNGFMQILQFRFNFGFFSVSFYEVTIGVMVGSFFLWLVYKLFD